LLILAWSLILIHVAIGFMISWSMGYQTYDLYVQEYGSFPFNYFDLIFASLPFIIVALVQLAVIPLCKVIYEHQNKLKKTLFLVGVILISLMSFETLSLAFERQFNNLFFEVQVIENKLILSEEKIIFNNDLITNSESLSDEEIESIKTTLINLINEKISLQLEILEAYKGNQLYRLGQSFYGLDNDELVTEQQLSIIAKVWYGSIAGILVLVPILLAFGAFGLKYGTSGKAENQVKIKDNEEKK